MLRFPPVPALFALVLLAAPTAPAAAQTPGDTIDALTPGRRALAFNLPNGGGVGLGVWKVVAPDRARGFFVNFAAGYNRNSASQSGVEQGTSSSLHVNASVGPQLRRYLARSAPVAPFVQSGLTLGIAYSRQSSSPPPVVGGADVESHSWSGNVGTSVAGGVEWFPFRRVSLGGQTGVTLQGGYSRSSGSSDGVSAGSGSSWSVSLSTFVSSLALQIYF